MSENGSAEGAACGGHPKDVQVDVSVIILNNSSGALETTKAATRFGAESPERDRVQRAVRAALAARPQDAEGTPWIVATS